VELKRSAGALVKYRHSNSTHGCFYDLSRVQMLNYLHLNQKSFAVEFTNTDTLVFHCTSRTYDNYGDMRFRRYDLTRYINVIIIIVIIFLNFYPRLYRSPGLKPKKNYYYHYYYYCYYYSNLIPPVVTIPGVKNK